MDTTNIGLWIFKLVYFFKIIGHGSRIQQFELYLYNKEMADQGKFS